MIKHTTEPRFACPIWCIIAPDQHEQEAPTWEGGALHWSQRLAGDNGLNEVRVAAVTDAAGDMNAAYPLIHMGDAELRGDQARALALDLLTAAALADMTRPS